MRIIDVKYFSISGSGYVEHVRPRHPLDQAFIALAPFMINTVLAGLLYAVSIFVFSAFLQAPETASSAPNYQVYLPYLLVWIAFSIGMHAVPSMSDASTVWRALRRRWPWSLLAFIGLPFAALLWIMTLFKFFWVDAVYSALIGIVVYAGFYFATYPSLVDRLINLVQQGSA